MPSPLDGLLYGLQLSVASDGKTVSASNGVAFLPGGVRIYTETSLTVVVSGITSAWAHFYLGLVSGVATLEASATVPSAFYQNTARTKTGDASKRYIGSIYFPSSGVCAPFLHSNFGMQGNRVDFLMPNGIANTAAAILNLGVSQTPVTVSCSTVCPPTTRLMRVQVINTAGLPAYIGNSDIGTPSATSYLRMVLPNNSDQGDFTLDANQQLNYVYGAGITLGGSLAIRAVGFIFDR